MGKLWMAALCLLGGRALAQQALTVEKIMRDPKWIGTSPSGLGWSPDGREVFFDWNPENAPSDSVYAVGLEGKPEKVAFQVGARARAEAGAAFNPTRSECVYAFEGDIFLEDLKTGKTIRVTKTEDAESDPEFVMEGNWIVYHKGMDLFAWDRKDGSTRQLTHFVKGGEAPSPGGRRGGAAAGGTTAQDRWLQREQLEWMQVLRERKEKRDAREAYLKLVRDVDTLKDIEVGDKAVSDVEISPDGRFVTYRLYEAPANVQRTVVPEYVTESGFTTVIPGRTKVGAPQGVSSFFLFDRLRDTVFAVKTDSIPGITDEPDYVKDYPAEVSAKVKPRAVTIYGPDWNEEGTAAVVDIQSQDFKDRWLMELDLRTGKLIPLDRQRDEAWIGGPGSRWLGDDVGSGWINDHLFWFESEASGYNHLYSYDLETHRRRALTSGNYEVERAVLSHDKHWFYLLTNAEHPGKRSWYRMPSAGGEAEKITTMDGMYDEVSLSPDEKWVAYRYSYTAKPWELYLQENRPGSRPVQITDKAMSAEYRSYPWRDTRIFTITARDGKPIYAKIYEPAPGKKNGAAVLFVHGAGYLQDVDYGWSYYFRESMFNNLLADKGYTVLDIDYRASAGYGRDWRTGIYRHMGGKDLDDEVDAAHYLVREEGIDSTRIGMYGGSYGGFMTLMALFTKPGVFAAGAALRPVTDWAHYNHGYTAAILNEPFEDSLAYRRSSPIYFAAGLRDHLLICHGMVDQNVHFQDDVRLVQRLIELGKDNWELAVYPMEDHGFVEPSSWTDEYKRILKLFDTWLAPGEPQGRR